MNNRLQSKYEGKSNQALLLCPYCLENFPFFTFHDNLEFQLEIQCSCKSFNKETIISLDDYIAFLKEIVIKQEGKCLCHNEISKDYCLHCSEWICKNYFSLHQQPSNKHTIITNKVNIKLLCCHIPSFTHYCFTCRINFCSECFGNYHFKHQSEKLKIFTKELIPRDFNTIFESLISYKNIKFIQFTQNIPNKEIKKQIKILYQKIEHINDNLQFLYNSLLYTLIEFINHPIYQLIDFFTTLQINKTQWDLSLSNTREESYETLKTYLTTNFILKQKEQYFYKSIISQSNEIKCMLQLTNDYLVIATQLGFLYIYQSYSDENKTLQKLCHDKAVVLLCQLNNDHFASYGLDNIIKIWNSNTFNCIQALFCLGEVKIMVSVNDYLIIFETGQEGKLWIRNKEMRTSFVKVMGSCFAIVPFNISIDNNNNSQIALCDYNGISVWNIITSQCIARIKHTFNDKEICLIQLTDGRLVYSSKNEIKVLNKKTYTNQASLTEHYYQILSLIELKNKELLSCSEDSMKFWDMTTFTCIKSLIGFACKPLCLFQLNDERIAFINPIEMHNNISYDNPKDKYNILALEYKCLSPKTSPEFNDKPTMMIDNSIVKELEKNEKIADDKIVDKSEDTKSTALKVFNHDKHQTHTFLAKLIYCSVFILISSLARFMFNF